MKKKILLIALLAVGTQTYAQFGNILDRAKQKLKDKSNAKVDQHLENATDKAVNTADTMLTGSGRASTSASSGSKTPATAASNTSQQTGNSTSPAQTNPQFSAFNNYDFVPGDKILFEDNFAEDQNGEFPSHWNLGAGQAVMNQTGDVKSLLITAGNYAHVSPLIKSASYLTDPFTIEFDSYTTGGYGPHIYFYNTNAEATKASNNVGGINLQSWGGVSAGSNDNELSADYPSEIAGENYYNKWHHIAIAYKKDQLKIYVDQYRVLVLPHLGITPHALDIEGIGDDKTPIIIANFRIASGGGMNMLGKKFTDAKIITHGINFDVDKATIKPESMGTLNMIVAVLKDNPEIKFEVDGHTDNSGTPAHNVTLSQQRAIAVKTQLVTMGVDASRLTSKGYGDTKPISDNVTIEGKANNRRVEFVKM